MALDFRALAIATAGFTAFVNLYSPQALLPELALEFGVGAGDDQRADDRRHRRRSRSPRRSPARSPTFSAASA